MGAKSWFLSKTLWFNVLALLTMVVASFGYTGELPAEWAVFVPAIVALVNLVLRFATKQPLQ